MTGSERNLLMALAMRAVGGAHQRASWNAKITKHAQEVDDEQRSTAWDSDDSIDRIVALNVALPNGVKVTHIYGRDAEGRDYELQIISTQRIS